MSDGARTSDEGVRVPCTEVRIEREGLRRRLRWAALGLFAVPLTVVLALMTLRFSGDHRFAEALFFVMLGSPVTFLASLIAGRIQLTRAGSLSVEGQDLLVRRRGEVRVIPLSSLREGWISPLKGKLELTRTNGDRICARVTRVADGQALLEAAGLDAKQRTVDVLLGETTFLTVMSWLLGPAVVWPITLAISQIAPWPWPFNVWTFLALFMLLIRGVREVMGPARLVIGADGVIIHQGFRDRFVPYAQLASVKTTFEEAFFHLADGTTVRAKARHLDRDQQLQVESRIAAAKDAWHAGSAEASALARLDRQGRTAAAWRGALTGLLTRDAGYREARVTREHLLAALGSAAAPAERRLGAALALRAQGGEEAAEVTAKIRVAAEACANPRLRIALEKVAAGAEDDAAIEEAIAAEETGKKRR